MPHPFFSKPIRTIEQAVRDLLDEAKRRNDSEMHDRALKLGIYAVTRNVVVRDLHRHRKIAGPA